MLPFMAKLGLSPKAEQPFEIARGLMGLTEGAVSQPSPWRRLMGMIPEAGGQVNKDLAVFPERGRVSFAFKPQGTAGDIAGLMSPGENPKDAMVSYIGSTTSRRLGTGNEDIPLQDFRFDIKSPAQREFQGRGFQPPAPKRPRSLRAPEERAEQAEVEAGTMPRATFGQKQQAADKFMDLLRRAGFEGLTFSAEAGERPRLYEKLTGYKAQPMGETSMQTLLNQLPARAEHIPAVEHVLRTNRMTPQMAENLLGLTADEALEYGLARRAGGDFVLTPEGSQAARDWLGQQGRF